VKGGGGCENSLFPRTQSPKTDEICFESEGISERVYQRWRYTAAHKSLRYLALLGHFINLFDIW
jgi:hypothetical protein